jgi:hypothetical protein
MDGRQEAIRGHFPEEKTITEHPYDLDQLLKPHEQAPAIWRQVRISSQGEGAG